MGETSEPRGERKRARSSSERGEGEGSQAKRGWCCSLCLAWPGACAYVCAYVHARERVNQKCQISKKARRLSHLERSRLRPTGEIGALFLALWFALAVLRSVKPRYHSIHHGKSFKRSSSAWCPHGTAQSQRKRNAPSKSLRLSRNEFQSLTEGKL